MISDAKAPGEAEEIKLFDRSRVTNVVNVVTVIGIAARRLPASDLQDQTIRKCNANANKLISWKVGGKECNKQVLNVDKVEKKVIQDCGD